MTQQLVFTVLASDRPGLVETLADVIAEAGGNWVESSMARLGGEFAGIVSAEIPNSSVERLKTRLAALKEDGISVTVRAHEVIADVEVGTRAHLEITSKDHPGILRDVTQVLAEHKVSIEQLETSVEQGSMQGGAMFRAFAELRLPDGVTPDKLSEALHETAGDLMADITPAD